MATAVSRLRGCELTKRLEELSSEANGHFYEAGTAWRNALEHAKLSGKALQAAFLLLRGGGGRWGDWVRRNFAGSRRTADDYRTVYREWDSPKLNAARLEGLKLDSIQSVLNVLRSRGVRKQRPLTPDEELGDISRKRIVGFVAQEVSRMRLEEVQVFSSTLPETWYQYISIVKKKVEDECGEEYYEDEDRKLRAWIAERSRLRQEIRECQAAFYAK